MKRPIQLFSDSLGARLLVFFLAFVLLVAVLTAATIVSGFRRGQTTASETSRAGLEEQGKETLQIIAALQSGFGQVELGAVAQLGREAATFMVQAEGQPWAGEPDSDGFVLSPRGQIYDSSPDRVTDVVIPRDVPLDDEMLRSIRASAALNAILPSLLAERPEVPESANFDPIAIYFIDPRGMARYYPPSNIVNSLPAELDVSGLFGALGADQNPERRPLWTPIYEDQAGRGPVMTVYTPVVSSGRLLGAIGVDLSVARLIEQVNDAAPTENGFALFMDRGGNIMKTSSAPLVEAAAADPDNAPASDLLEKMRAGERGIMEVRLDGRDYFIAYAPFGQVGGSLAMAAPVGEVTEQAAVVASSIDREAERTLLLTLGVLALLFAAGIAAATWLNRRMVLRPIAALVTGTRQVAAGNLAVRLPESAQDEFGLLARSFNSMTDDLRESYEMLERRVEDRTRELRALLEVSNSVASSLDSAALVRVVLTRLREVIEYSTASLLLREDDRLVIVDSCIGATLKSRPNLVGLHVAIERMGAIWGTVSRGQPVLIDDVRGESEYATLYRQIVGEAIDGIFRTERAWLAVPLVVRGRTEGLIVVASEQPAFLTRHHTELVTAFASHVAVAFENAALLEQAQALAAMEERQRLARELHDSVSQALYGIALGARTARTQLDRDPAAAVEPVDYVLALAEAGLAEMRALIFELRPESLETEGIVAALQKQAAAVEARYGITVDLPLGDEPDLALAGKEALYRIGQEALHNVVKHSQATRVEVRLTSRDADVLLQVRDNGVGFDSTAEFPGHLGLQSMQERAEGLGGLVVIESGPGGTCVRAVLPVHGRAES